MLTRVSPVSLPQSNLTTQQNGFKITLKTLEDNLLSRLSSASGDFLGDTELVENLETTKLTAGDIEEKVSLHLTLSGAVSLCLCLSFSFSLSRSLPLSLSVSLFLSLYVSLVLSLSLARSL